MTPKTLIALGLVVSGCMADAGTQGLSCNNPATAKATLSLVGPVILHALSCPSGESVFDIALEVHVGDKIIQRERSTAEGLAYVLEIDQSLDVDGDGVRDVGVANGKGRAGDGMTYWLVKRDPPHLIPGGEAPRLALSTDGKPVLYSLVPGSGEVQATRADYQLIDGRLRRIRSLQFVPVDDLRTEIREQQHSGDAGSQFLERSRRLVANEQAQRCMDGGRCP